MPLRVPKKRWSCSPIRTLLWEKHDPLKMSQKAWRLGPGTGKQGSEPRCAPAPQTARWPLSLSSLPRLRPRPFSPYGWSSPPPRRTGGGCCELRRACPRPGRPERRAGSPPKRPLPSTPRSRGPCGRPASSVSPISGAQAGGAQDAPSRFPPLAPSIALHSGGTPFPPHSQGAGGHRTATGTSA